MSSIKQVKCSVCGQPMKTMFGALMMRSAPVVCRRCFGEQSYGGTSNGKHAAVVLPDRPAAEGIDI